MRLFGDYPADIWPAGARELLACPDCPMCGNAPHLIISPIQAACGTNGCPALLWNPSRTREQNLASETLIDLPDGLLDEPGTVVTATFARHHAGCDGTCGRQGGCADG